MAIPEQKRLNYVFQNSYYIEKLIKLDFPVEINMNVKENVIIMYLYKITNKINNKSYIGITNNYKKRWGNECSYPSDPKRRQVI